MTGAGSSSRAPEPISNQHRIEGFESGVASLDEGLRRRALKNQETGATRTYVICDPHLRVLGYYSLSACTMSHSLAIGLVRRNMPEPIPMILLGRLAIALGCQGRGLGSGMLKDAVLRAVQAAEHVGVRAPDGACDFRRGKAVLRAVGFRRIAVRSADIDGFAF